MIINVVKIVYVSVELSCIETDLNYCLVSIGTQL